MRYITDLYERLAQPLSLPGIGQIDAPDKHRELRLCQLHVAIFGTGPAHAPLFHATRANPRARSIVKVNLHAVFSLVGEEKQMAFRLHPSVCCSSSFGLACLFIASPPRQHGDLLLCRFNIKILVFPVGTIANYCAFTSPVTKYYPLYPDLAC